MASNQPVLLIETIDGASDELYDAVADRVAFPSKMPGGLVFHVAGETAGGLIEIDVFESEKRARRWKDGKRVEAIEQFEAAAGVEFTYGRMTASIDRAFAIPALAGRAYHAPIDGYRLRATLFVAPLSHSFHYFATASALGIPDNWPPGMLLHLVGQTKEHWIVFDLFETPEQEEELHEPALESMQERTAHEGGLAQTEITRFTPHMLVLDSSATVYDGWTDHPGAKR